MADSLRFHPRVPYDLASAIEWYESISPHLATRFRDAVNTVFEKIETTPLIYAIEFDDVRYVRTARFPYVVQYRIRGTTRQILADGERVVRSSIAATIATVVHQATTTFVSDGTPASELTLQLRADVTQPQTLKIPETIQPRSRYLDTA